MTVTEKIKTMNNKIEQNKSQCNLGSQTAKISSLSSWNGRKYEFLTGEDILLTEKAAIIKKRKIEYSPLGIKLKKAEWHSKKKYQVLDKVYEFNKKDDVETPSCWIENQDLKNIINQIESTATNTLFTNIKILWY